MSTNNQIIKKFINSIGFVEMENDYGETVRKFPNGYSASVIDYDEGYSIACFDKNGWLDYDLPEKNQVYFCRTELQAMAVIERISKIGEWKDYLKAPQDGEQDNIV